MELIHRSVIGGDELKSSSPLFFFCKFKVPPLFDSIKNLIFDKSTNPFIRQIYIILMKYYERNDNSRDCAHLVVYEKG